MKQMFFLIMKKKKYIKISLLIILSLLLALFVLRKCNKPKVKHNIEYVDKKGTYHKYYEDGKFSELKKENKELYDSLKKYKKEIDYLVQFKYNKSYKTDTVIITKTKVKKETLYSKNEKGEFIEKKEEAKTYEYQNKPNDSVDYKLKINSEREPNWYSLDINVHDKITLVNKKEENGTNHLTINTDNKANITDVTTFKKKEKKNIFNKIAIVPGIYYGYDVKNKRMGYGVGITLGYNIFGTK